MLFQKKPIWAIYIYLFCGFVYTLLSPTHFNHRKTVPSSVAFALSPTLIINSFLFVCLFFRQYVQQKYNRIPCCSNIWPSSAATSCDLHQLWPVVMIACIWPLLVSAFSLKISAFSFPKASGLSFHPSAFWLQPSDFLPTLHFFP